MKTKVILTLCLVFVLALASTAMAQLIAGSPEDKAFEKIVAENNPDAKMTLLLDYEKQFPQSKALSDVYIMQLTIYQQKNDATKVIDVGEKAIKIDGENLTALLAVSRNYSLERKNLDRAIQYAQKAVDTVAKMRTLPTPPQYTSADQWKEYLEGMDSTAKSILAYAKALKP